MKAVIKIPAMITVLLITGSYSTSSCSTNKITLIDCKTEKQNLSSSKTTRFGIEQPSFLNIMYSPGINF
jgi:hypothetical protein